MAIKFVTIKKNISRDTILNVRSNVNLFVVKVPLTMKRMLQGQRIQWETIPQAAQPTASAMNIPFQHNAFPAETEVACGVGGVGGGVYKDRYRWLAVLFVPQGGGQGRHHLLGRFDSEDEANVAYKWV